MCAECVCKNQQSEKWCKKLALVGNTSPKQKMRMFCCNRPGEFARRRSKFCQLISTQQNSDTVLINLALAKSKEEKKVTNTSVLDRRLRLQARRVVGGLPSNSACHWCLPPPCLFINSTWYSQNLPPNADSPDDLHKGSTEHYREIVKARCKLLPIILWKLTCQNSLFHLAPERWVRTRTVWGRRHVWFGNQ